MSERYRYILSVYCTIGSRSELLDVPRLENVQICDGLQALISAMQTQHDLHGFRRFTVETVDLQPPSPELIKYSRMTEAERMKLSGLIP